MAGPPLALSVITTQRLYEASLTRSSRRSPDSSTKNNKKTKLTKKHCGRGDNE